MSLKTTQPVRLLIVTIASSFLAEIAVAAFFDAFPPASKLMDILGSAVLSTTLILPFLYIFLLRPLMDEIDQREQMEQALQREHALLELRVQERTEELAQANQALLQIEIAARKKIEGQLRLQTTALEAAANGVFITDAQGRIQWSNPAFSLLTGHSRESILGQTPRILKSGVQDQEYYRQLWKTIQSGKVWQSEIVNRRADGTFYHEEQTITPVLDEDGKISHFIAIQHDITERKQAEAKISAHNQKLEALYQSELRARQIAETLRSASLALTETLNLPTVANTLLDYVAQLVPYQDASVVLFESDDRSKAWAINGYTQVADPVPALDAYFQPKANPFTQTLMAQGHSLLVPDTSQQSDWIPLPGQEDIRTWLGIPLFAGGRMIGFCELSQPGSHAFTEKHIQWIEALASQSAVVIQNSWLYEQVRAGRERLQSLSRRLVEIQENERRHIARELHDEAGQMLTSLMIGLELLERDARDPESVIAGIAELNRIVDEVLENLHRLAVDLRPASLDHLGLVAALRQYVENISDKHNLMFSFQVLGLTQRLPAELETTLYRIVQEALTNVLRHANASRIDILLEQRSNRVIAMIEDNGVGFEPLSQTQSDQLGLFGMRERVEMLNGSIRIDSSAQNGTAIFVEVPYDDPDTGRG